MGLISTLEWGLSLALLWPYILDCHWLCAELDRNFSQWLLIKVCYKGCQQQAGTLRTLYVGRFELGL